MSKHKSFEKYGVDENDSDVKTAQDGVTCFCPWCSRRLESRNNTNVLKCPKHGTKPFETPCE